MEIGSQTPRLDISRTAPSRPAPAGPAESDSPPDTTPRDRVTLSDGQPPPVVDMRWAKKYMDQMLNPPDPNTYQRKSTREIYQALQGLRNY